MIVGKPETVELIIQATVVLHNYLRTVHDQTYTPPGYADTLLPDGTIVDGAWRRDPLAQEGLQPTTRRNATLEANRIRTQLTRYFCGPGSVDWQLAHIHSR